MISLRAFWPVPALLFAAGSFAAQPVLDNERVTVWDTREVIPNVAHDFVAVPLYAKGTATFGHKGDSAGRAGKRSIVIEIKDVKPSPLPNPGKYPPAFPRPHTRKLFENDKVIVWATRWVTGEPTPMHFHDKDAMVVYEDTGRLRATALDGTVSGVDVTFGGPRYALRDRTHQEVLESGKASAVITELK
jgi:hypothetical protein